MLAVAHRCYKTDLLLRAVTDVRFGSIADMIATHKNVRLVPEADMEGASQFGRLRGRPPGKLLFGVKIPHKLAMLVGTGVCP